MVVTRRGLVAAGAGVLLAGCGADAEPPPPDDELLGAVAAFERSLVRAYARVPGRLGRVLGERAAELERRLGRPGADVTPPQGDPLEAALTLERRCMGACVAAIGDVREPTHRALAADAMTASAEHAAILLERLGRDPLESPFPDGREARP